MRTTNRLSIIVSCVALALALICGPSATVTAADRGQGVTADQLPGELRALTVQNQFIPGQGTPVGKVRRLRGHLVVRHGNSPEAYFAKQGDRLYTHDELFTLAKSRVRVRFTTADIVNMGANTRIRVDELVDDRQTRQKKTRMSMLRGKAMFYVMRLMKYNKVDTQVNTPTAVCGVRGTKFGIIVQKKTDLWSSMPLYLADASGTPLNYLLADNGGGTETIMVMVEGSGFMTAGGTTTGLGSGQTGSSGGGPPSTGPTPPGLGQGLNDETNPGDGDGGDGDGDGEGGDDGGGDTGDSGTTGDAGQDASDTVNQITQQGLAPAGPTNRIGYFAAMLTNDTGWPLLDSLFISPELADHEGPGIMGTSVNSASYTITFDGSPEDDPVLTQVDTYYSGSPSDLGPQHQVLSTQVGVNAFLAWGYWTMPTPFYSGTYVIDNPGVYVHGDPTPVENMGGITGHYVGSAWGTYWNSSGGATLAGTMSADVAIGSQKLQNLNVSVTGGGNTVSIVQQSETYFSGPNGEFMLQEHYGGGNVQCLINGTAVEHGIVSGGLFGPNGEALGGTAAMRSGFYGNYEGAVVGFEGAKQ